MKENNFPPQITFTNIAERIMVVMFPSEDHETTYVSNMVDVAQMLSKKYADNYLMVNLSDRRNDMHKMHRQVIDFGWPDTLAPPLERLCNICKCVDSFLTGNPKNNVVIHCKGGLGRLAVVLSAYIDYSNICASDEKNLDQFSMKNFYDNKLAGCTHPSQRRYVHYFAGLLSGGISINNEPLFLHQIVIRGVPNFDGKGGCCPYIKIYQGMKPVYVSGVFSSSSNLNQIIVTLDPCLQLRSDILVKCYNKSKDNFNTNREVIFRCQFHTGAINNNFLKFGKTDLDEACQDSRFPNHGQVEFVLSDSIHNWNKYEIPASERNILIGTSPESIERWNSYENFAGPVEDVTFETMNSRSNISRKTERQDDYNFKRSATSNINKSNEFASTSVSTTSASKKPQSRDDYSPSRRFVETNNNWINGNAVQQDFESLRVNDRGGNTNTTTKEYRDAKGRKCQTIETETFSRRCETTSSQFANNNQSTNQAAITSNTSQKQLMPPPRSSTPSTPVIPERSEASREAYMRNTYSLKPIGDYTFDHDNRSHTSLPRLEPSQPVEVEIVSLQPIGPGVQTLEPTTPNTGTLMRTTTPGLAYPTGTIGRDFNTITNSVSVPTSLATLQPSPTNQRPPSVNQMRSYSRNDNYNMTVQPTPAFHQQTLQKVSTVNNGPLPLVPMGSATLPHHFTTQQPFVQSYKETQSWSTTHNPSINTPGSAGATLQRYPAQMGGSVQHLNQQQISQRTMNSTVDSRSIPVLVQHHDGTLTAPVTNNTVPSIVLQRQATMQEQLQQQQLQQQQQQLQQQLQQRQLQQQQQLHGMVQQPHGFIQQQTIRQQYVQQQQPIIQQQQLQQQQLQQQQQQSTIRSSSSQNKVFAENNSTVGSNNAAFMTGSQSATTTTGTRRIHSQSSATAVNEGGATVVLNRSRTGSFSSAIGGDYDFVNTSAKFVKDSSKIWHRSNFTREDAIQYLKDKAPGSFVIRNSATYPGAYGLTLRVAQVPDNVPLTTGDPQLELIRHFIIEPTAKGVQLKGSPLEPVFASLSAFVYQHSITPLSLPCALVIPDAGDVFEDQSTMMVGSSVLSQTAACNVLYIDSLDTESLTGPEALSKALDEIFKKGSNLPRTVEVHFLASHQGITITDNARRKFFRNSYLLNSITYLGLDNQENKWNVADYDGRPISSGRVFGFVAKKSSMNNACHLFAELDPSSKPAHTLIDFITKIMREEGRQVTKTST